MSLIQEKQPFLEAYSVSPNPQPLYAAPSKRDWMDEFTNHHAYRCLPLAIANTYGWQLILPVDVTAEWDGGKEQGAIKIDCVHPHQAVSNFKRGVLTFDVGYIFRTSPGYHLMVIGPTNTFKDGIAPMTAVVETDWLPYTFTMNYQFTRPCLVKWKAGEPYAQICVVSANLQNDIQPVIRSLRENPELKADHEAWRSKRSDLRQNRATRDASGSQRDWDKDYFLGRYADGRGTGADHVTKLRLKDPKDERKTSLNL